jgi:aminoglycoside phosphotransferase (APT) family kinase protein
VSARSQPGGFSPGSADRVITAAGRRAFVKTAWRAVNAEATDIHRREARKSASLPSGIPVPRLIGAIDRGDWVAVVFDDIEGRHPFTPWRADEILLVLDALAEIAAPHLPVSDALPPLEDELVAMFAGWSRIDDLASAPLDAELAAWALPLHAEFVRMSSAALDDLRGDRLVHLDARADNLLIRPDGTVAVVDWPWAARGAGWFDALALLVNVRLYDPGHDTQAVIATHRAFREMPTDAATRVLVGLAGFFLEGSMQPDKPGIPTLRSFQRDQAIATLGWLRERLPR